MFGEGLPRECDGCGEDVAGLYEHADGCPVAKRLAEREIERIEELPQGWHVEKHDRILERCREIVDA